MNLIINGFGFVMPEHVNTVSVTKEIKTAKDLEKAIKLALVNYGKNKFDAYLIILKKIKGVTIHYYKENKSISFSFNNTHSYLVMPFLKK